MSPPATATPIPTLIRRNQRYAGSQIAVAATMAAATTNAAVPRIGIVIFGLTDSSSERLPLLRRTIPANFTWPREPR